MQKTLIGILFFLTLALLAFAGVSKYQTPAEMLATQAAGSNEQAYKLIDIAPQLGLHQNTKTWSAESADFNNDKRPDILLVRHNSEPEILYINSENGFIANDIGRPADRHHCAAADVNLDGRLDSYCSVGAARGAGKGGNNLYLQQADGSFSDVAAQYGVTDPYGRGRWVTFLNANGDAYPDLFVGNSPDRSDGKVSSNKLFINDGGEQFLASESFGIDLVIGSHCSIATDFNADGLDDLLLCSKKQGLRLYINNGGTHFDDASKNIKGDRYWARAVLADINGDAVPDLVTLRPKQLAIHYRQGNSFKKVDLTTTLATGVDVAAGDADGDGDIDLFVVQFGCEENTEGPSIRLPQRDDFLMLNDGHGQFTQVSASHMRPAQGCGGQVLPIDYDGDGRSEFLIMNGRARSTGPLQLLQLVAQ